MDLQPVLAVWDDACVVVVAVQCGVNAFQVQFSSEINALVRSDVFVKVDNLVFGVEPDFRHERITDFIQKLQRSLLELLDRTELCHSRLNPPSRPNQCKRRRVHSRLIGGGKAHFDIGFQLFQVEFADIIRAVILRLYLFNDIPVVLCFDIVFIQNICGFSAIRKRERLVTVGKLALNH